MSIDLSQVTLMKRQQVEAVTSLSRSTLYDMMAKGRFPKPVRLGPNRVGYNRSWHANLQYCLRSGISSYVQTLDKCDKINPLTEKVFPKG